MGQARGTEDNWAQAWIDEQRQKLRAAGAGTNEGGPSSSAPQSLALLWAQLGTDLLAGYDKLLRAGIPETVPLGWAREREQEWRDLTAAQAEYQNLYTQVLSMLAAVQAQALDRVEHIVRERARENRPFAHVRELYDLWIECGEQAYATMARAEEYCRLQAALGNAGIQLRAQQQKLIERVLKQFDLPTRAELNSVHRELRALRERLEPVEQPRTRPAKSRAPTLPAATAPKKRTNKTKRARK